MRRLALPCLLLLAGGGFAWGQLPEAQTLQAAKREQAEATARSERLERAARAAGNEAARTSAEAAALVARIEAAEAGITAAETRLRIVEQQRAEQRTRLAERQAPLVKLTAALQTMAQRPPALALVQRGSLDEIVHVRALLASALPQVQARTAALRQEIARAEQLRGQAELAVRALERSRTELARRRGALAALEEQQRRRSADLTDAAIVESTRALAFSEAARDLSELAETRGYRQRLQAELGALPGPVPRPGQSAPERIAAYALPVEGRLATGTGEVSDAGVHSRGLLFDTRALAPVVAPRAGRIVFARPFRDYGNVVVIDHGLGWTTTLTGLGKLAVERGVDVAAGAPIGAAPARAARIGVELRRGGRPVSITALAG